MVSSTKTRSMLRVLLITGSYPPMKCGVGSYTKRLAVALAECEDVNVTVLTDERAKEAEKQKKVEVLSVIRGWRIAELIIILKHIKNIDPDIIHIQYPTQGYSGRMPLLLPFFMRLLGRTCVQTWHEPLSRLGCYLSIRLNILITVKKEFMSSLPKLRQIALRKTKLVWIPAASLLPAVTLSDEDRDNIRNRYFQNVKLLLVFYGFLAPIKGVEALFEIVKKTNANLIFASDFNPVDNYHRDLLTNITAMGISSRISIAGFLPDVQLASILAAADAVVLPFRDGAKDWNTSIDGALAQGTFVLTTSLTVNGYDKKKNIYFAKPGNIDEMIESLQNYAGCRTLCKPAISEWQNIAKQHLKLYHELTTT